MPDGSSAPQLTCSLPVFDVAVRVGATGIELLTGIDVKPDFLSLTVAPGKLTLQANLKPANIPDSRLSDH